MEGINMLGDVYHLIKSLLILFGEIPVTKGQCQVTTIIAGVPISELTAQSRNLGLKGLIYSYSSLDCSLKPLCSKTGDGSFLFEIEKKVAVAGNTNMKL